MVFKSIDRFYLTFEVDLVSMTVIFIKDGKEGKTYDAGQYFQYFVEYGVRKADIAQLKEHFSIDYFQQMLVMGKDSEAFEFCVNFAGEDYKILRCKMRSVERHNSNIIKIVLEDVSHKRLQQLTHIKNHFAQHQYKSQAKHFNIKFEEKKDNFEQNKKFYKLLMGLAGLLCIVISFIFFQGVYEKNIQATEAETLNRCRNTSQVINQQLDRTALGLKAFNYLLSQEGYNITEQELIQYIEEEKSNYGYTGMAFVDKNRSLMYTNEALEYLDANQLAGVAEDNNADTVTTAFKDFEGGTQINCIISAEEANIGGRNYELMLVAYDLNKLCSTIPDMGNRGSSDTVVVDRQGNILWSDNPQISPAAGHKNIFNRRDKPENKEMSQNGIESLHEKIRQGESGVLNFSMNGKNTFAAYTPLEVEDLFVISLSRPGNPMSKATQFLLSSLGLWLMLMILPLMYLLYRVKKFNNEKKHLEKLAYMDNVTGGGNLNYFDEKAKHIIREMECHYALVVTNLQNFSLYNEKYGAVRGDRVIRSIFMGISKYLDDEELFCRAYAEHMMILMKYECENELEERLEAIGKSVVDTGFKMEFGVCIIRDLTMELDVAKERANMALGNKVNKQKNNIIIYYYDLTLLETIIFDKDLENTMYNAFRKGEFEIFVEPRYNLKRRALCNGDAYAVWNHPEKGALMPEEYERLFERKGIIMCLDSLIFEGICSKIKEHLKKGRGCLPITIKLHRNHFNVNDFINKFRSIKERYGVPGEYLCFEISEETMFEKLEQMNSIFECIHKMGASCTLGDYNGNIMPFEVLKNMKIDCIKYSQTFLEEELPERMVKALIDIGKSVDANTAMTGVSNQFQAAFLTDMDCDEAKGDAFAKNISLDEYINIL